MTIRPLDAEAIEDYIEDFEDASRLGQEFDAVSRKLVRRSPSDEAEIREAQKRMEAKLGLPNTQRRLVSYHRNHPARDWYRPRDEDHFWPRLRGIIEKDLGDAIIGIDESSTNVLNGMKTPFTPQNTRGLVLGYVQSGKTTNFISVIAKAADAGFRLIIVLTGITDNLRQQTQDRIDQQLVSPQAQKWTRLTDHDHDFAGDKNGTKLGNLNDRFIAVVKKNPHRLRRLNEWIIEAGDAGHYCPILVIDDEADQASINVSPRDKAQQSAINKQISELLNHQTTVYVAYTATPFANILIDPNKDEDLYPRDFIVTLPEPEGYFGSEALFGRSPVSEEDLAIESEELDGYDMIRTIPEDEVDGIRPGSGKDKGTKPVVGGEQLEAAIRWFLMASAARRVRGQEGKHSSMLIHTSMLTDDHEELRFQVEKQLNEIKVNFESGADRVTWSDQWDDESRRVPAGNFDLKPVRFDQIEAVLPSVLNDVEIVVDNGRSQTRLNYNDGPATVIAIGGNTLSRGLTLEGLVSSYFVRRASAYDTLLQMGRWFGFRPNYQDLPRIWMPNELRRWFFDLATIEAELREELRVYMEYGQSPMDVQARIRLHPDMQVTNRAKMQYKKDASMSFSGVKEQTFKFKHRDAAWLKRNLEAARQLVQEIKKYGIKEKTGLYESPVFERVPSSLIVEFLENYSIHEGMRLGEDNARLLKDYVKQEADARRIRYWSVSFMTQNRNEKVGTIDLGLSQNFRKITRAKLNDDDESTANIKALVTTQDRLNDVIRSDFEERKEFRKHIEERISEGSKEAIVRKLHAEHVGAGVAHLAVYPIDAYSPPRGWDHKIKNPGYDPVRVPLEAVLDVIGIGIFFPESRTPDAAVSYISAAEPDEELREVYLQMGEERMDVYDSDGKALESEEHEDAAGE